TEADLCTAFMDVMRAADWTCYPEQGGWDVLCVRRRVQIGVQAKLVANQHVLMQALPDLPVTIFRGRKKEAGPTYRAVLVGQYTGRTPQLQHQTRSAFGTLARHLRLLVFDCRRGDRVQMADDQMLATWHSHPGGRSGDYTTGIVWNHYRWRTGNVWTPPFVPTHAAGVPSPQTVSPWVIAALDLERLCVRRGWVTRADAVACARGWNPGTMLNRYFRCTIDKDGSQRKWVLAALPSIHYPQAAEAYP
ncbi:MAG: hypothetical protein WC700_18995, partial [Gemmatimonadaceae bacterium]